MPVADGQQPILEVRLRRGRVVGERSQPLRRPAAQRVEHGGDVEQAPELGFAHRPDQFLVVERLGEVGQRARGARHWDAPMSGTVGRREPPPVRGHPRGAPAGADGDVGQAALTIGQAP